MLLPAVDSALGQDIYQRYAAALYRQALLTVDDSALAEHAVCDVLVNERALAALPGISCRGSIGGTWLRSGAQYCTG